MRLSPAIVIGIVLAVVAALALKFAGLSLSQGGMTALLLGIMAVAYGAERIFKRR